MKMANNKAKKNITPYFIFLFLIVGLNDTEADPGRFATFLFFLMLYFVGFLFFALAVEDGGGRALFLLVLCATTTIRKDLFCKLFVFDVVKGCCCSCLFDCGVLFMLLRGRFKEGYLSIM